MPDEIVAALGTVGSDEGSKWTMTGPMARCWRTPFVLLLLTLSSLVHAQSTWPAYERFRTTFQAGDQKALRTLAEAWSMSADPREKHLGLLALASSEFRADNLPACLNLLDSIRATVPAAEFAIHAIAQRISSSVFTQLGDATRAIQEADLGLGSLPDTGFSRERITLMTVRAEGLLYSDAGLDSAFRALASVERLAHATGYLIGQAGAENDMGLIRLNQGRFDEAWAHFHAALTQARAGGSEVTARNAVTNLSLVAVMAGRYETALQLCDSLLDVLGGNSPEFRASLYSEKGVIHRKRKDHESALDCFARALALKDTVGEVRSIAKAAQHVATEYWTLGRKEDAFRAMADALRAAERMHWGDLQAEIHIELHDWYDSLGRGSEALSHLQAHVALADSLYKMRYDDQLARSEALFGSEKKERRITEQDQALKLAETEDRRKSLQRNVSVGAAALMLFIAVLLYRSMRARQLLANTVQELHTKNVDQLLSQQEIKSINAMLEGQEKERDRVAKDLHDRLGSMLGGIKAQLGALEDRLEQVQHDAQFKQVNRLLDETVGELRQISHDMAASTLSRFGLEKALNDLRDTIHVSGRLSVEMNAFGLEQRLERSVEIAVYRIIQELVSNVLKHAKASELSIAVTRSPGRLSVMVADNGVGFDSGMPKEGMGLENVRSRAAALGGTVQVDSTPGKGATVSLECPVVE